MTLASEPQPPCKILEDHVQILHCVLQWGVAVSYNGGLPGRPALYLVIYINVRAALRNLTFA